MRQPRGVNMTTLLHVYHFTVTVGKPFLALSFQAIETSLSQLP